VRRLLAVVSVFVEGFRAEARAAAWRLEPTPEMCIAIPRHAPIAVCYCCRTVAPVPQHALCATCANALDLAESRYLSTLGVHA
jgi:hypothetical protein